MKLSDLIIEKGPFVTGDVMPFPVNPNGHPIIRAAEMNELRDELIELRQLRAAVAKADYDQCGCLGGILAEWGVTSQAELDELARRAREVDA